MKLFVFASFLAVAMAKPSAILAPTFYAAPIAAHSIATAPVISQYHSQDELGQYSYGYNGGLSAKTETKTFDGITRGAYSYVDAEGKLQSVEYTADALNGFRAAASNLPVAPVDDRMAPEAVRETEEVAKARAEHLVAFEEAKVRAAAAPEIPETPAVVETRAAVVPLTKAITPILAPAPIAAPFIETRPLAYSYAYSAPAFGYAAYPYHFGYPYQFAARSALPLPIAPIAGPQLIPQPVMETPEVAKARAEHLAEVAKARM